MRAFMVMAAVASACISAGSGPPPEGDVTPGEPFPLRMGEERQLPSEELAVRFAALVGDSRCPRDVTCFWEGDAEIEVDLSRGEQRTTLRLHTHPDRGRQAAALGCSVRLEALDPYPQTSDPIPPEDYVATLVIALDGG